MLRRKHQLRTAGAIIILTTVIAWMPHAAEAATIRPAPPSTGASINGALYGVTLDDVSNLSAITASLAALPKRPTVRIVFDEGQPPSAYSAAINAIKPHAFIMGEVLDSEYVATLSVDQYRARFTEYVNAFAGSVDIWEIGNEVNGEWLGTSADVVAKIAAAYGVVKARGLQTALTLYYNPNCWERRDHEMFTWTSNQVPASIKQGIDYLFISYYEVDCNNYRPTSWTPVFDHLHQIFPNSKLGFGEVGMGNPVRTASTTAAQAIARYYYGLHVTTPGYVGGYFWWYFREDGVPSSKPMFKTIASAIATAT